MCSTILVIVASHTSNGESVYWSQADGVYVDDKREATRYDSEAEARKDFRARLTQNVLLDPEDRMDLALAEWGKA